MKKLLLLVALFCSSFIFSAVKAQDFFSDIAENVEESPNSKALLWSNLKSWVSNNFTSYSFVVDMEDKESGRMIIKFNFSDTNLYTKSTVSSVLQVDVKDKKFRTRIYDMEYKLLPKDSYSDMSFLPKSILERALIELGAAQSLQFFGKSMDDLNQAIEYHEKKLKEVPVYKRPKDERKGKINKEYSTVKEAISLGNSVKNHSYYVMTTLLSSLREALNEADDF